LTRSIPIRYSSIPIRYKPQFTSTVVQCNQAHYLIISLVPIASLLEELYMSFFNTTCNTTSTFSFDPQQQPVAIVAIIATIIVTAMMIVAFDWGGDSTDRRLEEIVTTSEGTATTVTAFACPTCTVPILLLQQQQQQQQSTSATVIIGMYSFPAVRVVCLVVTSNAWTKTLQPSHVDVDCGLPRIVSFQFYSP